MTSNIQLIRGKAIAPWMVMAFLAAIPTPTMAQRTQPVDPPAAPEGFFREPRFLARVIDVGTRTMGDGSGEKSGFYPEMGNMITGAGWLSIGPGYRQWMSGDRMFVDASTAWSWRSYKMARARFEVTNLARSRVAVGTEVRWQDFTQNTFFGAGAESLEANRSEYRLRSANVVGYTDIRPVRWLIVGGRGGWLQQPELLEPGGTFRRTYPATQTLFPNEPAFALQHQPSYAYGEASITADTRDHRSHPLRGGVYRGAWTRYTDRTSGTFSFQRFEAEGAQFVPAAGSRVTFALRGWLVASDTAEGDVVPFYLMPSLGGNNTLRAFANYRFHDRHLAVVNLEARVALFTHLDAAIFADAGNVADRMADLNLDKTSFGVGLRLHSDRSTFARIDVAHGSEGWRVAINTGDPLHLSRLSKRTAAVPFVP